MNRSSKVLYQEWVSYRGKHNHFNDLHAISGVKVHTLIIKEVINS